MGLTLTELVERIEEKEYYTELFINAFGTNEVTTDRISKAMAQFVRSLVSYQSKYDKGLILAGHPQLDFPNYTESENRGKALFNGTSGFRCSLCHGQDIQIANAGRNNGLDATIVDKGIGGITGDAKDMGKFKVPSLRNVMQRPPYMHDGRFASIEEVLEHYSTGIQDHPTLEHNLIDNDGNPKKFNMTPQEKQDLISFFHTLTDSVISSDPKFSDPFQ
jgi:cytochrome c peroxidase